MIHLPTRVLAAIEAGQRTQQERPSQIIRSGRTG